MRDFALYLGHIKLTILIGIGSILASVFISYVAVLLFHIPFVWSNFILAIIIPAIIAPSVSWFFLKIYFKLEKLEQEMRRLATYDSLTGLLSRKVFLDLGETLYKKIKAENKSFTVLYIDLDNFKIINDAYGHHVGDEVLRFLGKELLGTFREKDIIGRLGGEEVAVILLDTKLETISNIIKRIQYKFSHANLMFEEKVLNFTVSIGIAAISKKDDNLTLDNLIAQADKALYKAKNSGKNCAYLYRGQESYEELTPRKK
jgi:diguanylate cyclase (GGDEF)-like protein